jgi:hypothetical protein
MTTSIHHYDVAWCVIGKISILYHANISVNVSVNYDERSVFGSHGAYAVWTGTSPKSISVSSNMVSANSDEVKFNIDQVKLAHEWTQGNPPKCEQITAPASEIFNTSVRIESYDSSIDEGVHLDGGNPIQISLSLSLKECKAI